MGVSSSYLSRADVQQMLGINAFGLWRLERKYDDFPQPTVPHGSFRNTEEVWDGTEVYRWAADTPEFAHRGAVLLRPRPEHLDCGSWAGYTDTVRGPALDWHTVLGTVRIVYADDRKAATEVASAVAATGKPDQVVTVCALYGDIGFTGPALIASDTAHPAIEYEAEWGDVAALAGQALPWWPNLLRLPRLIRTWQPGTPAAIADVPPNDNEKILRQAAHNEVFDTVARAAVTDMANHIRNNRINRAEQENKVFGTRRFGAQPHPVVIAAKPDTAGHPLPCEGDRQALKAGWYELARSNHPDAVAALEVAVGHDPELLEFGAVTEVPVQPGTITEQWARRLAPCDPSAAHAVLAHGDPVNAFFTDPLTDMPALRTAGDGGSPVWRFYAPPALPASGAELATIVLEHTVWITTSDGQVHPAPCTPAEHLWWGDGRGDRPTEVATVIDTLLDDLGATVSLREHWKAPHGLTALFNEEHEHGTELTRSTLLVARMASPRTR
ncbi:hypothetical protein [Streptomyces sp. NBC_01431]|uniref:hypothetical protein n=1 Tax=Streptomyces sp. NBC_01431 TaxID=2903863 RepID=UPI002E3241ED|nr:hypothetical protein [Streptomyces sp. NBC_01431]